MENSLLYSEVSCVCILILLLLCAKIGKSMFLQSQRHLFFYVVIANILLFVLDAMWIFVNNKVLSIAIPINWLLNSAYYITGSVIGFLWFYYSEDIQESKLVRQRKYMMLSCLPIALLIIAALLTPFTGWLFYVDAQNVYHRGPIYPAQMICTFGYVLFTAVKAFIRSLSTVNYRRKKELQALSSFVIPTVLAATLQVIFPRYPLLCVGNTIGLLYVFLTLQEQLVSIDALTKLNNRNQLFQYLSTKLSHIREGSDLYLLIMDVDHFKHINDRYGHVEGDQALKAVATCLMQCCGKKRFFICRYGGDEFIVIGEMDYEESVNDLCQTIHETMAKVETPYKLSLSIGCAKYEPSIKTQQEFIARADKDLYSVKDNKRRTADEC